MVRSRRIFPGRARWSAPIVPRTMPAIADPAGPLRRRARGAARHVGDAAILARIKDGKLFGRGACDMKSGTIGALYALDAIKAAGLEADRAHHFQSVIEEESTGIGALSTLQRGYRADACFIPEPTSCKMVRAQVGVIWFRLKVRGFPVHVFEAGAGSNAITAAYHLVQALEKLKSDGTSAPRPIPFQGAQSSHQLQPRIIKGGDWASSVPAWCDVDCRIAVLPGWSIKVPERDPGLRRRGRPRSSFPLQQPACSGMAGLPVGRL